MKRLYRVKVWENPGDMYSLNFYVRAVDSMEAISKVEESLRQQNKSAYNMHSQWIDVDGTFVE